MRNLASWVDQITNESFVENMDDKSFRDIFFGQNYPKEIFFRLIHEATHHWCFTSFIGNTSYMLMMRSYFNSLKFNATEKASFFDIEGKQQEDDKVFNIHTDYLKSKTLLQIFDPLIEGIALFAEYDVYPSKFEGMPHYLIYMNMMYSGVDRDKIAGTPIHELEKTYFDFLTDIRIFENTGTLSKANLLATTYNGNNCSYLLGYLFVKNLQLALKEENEEFSDSVMFIQFIRSYYFNDLELVEMLLTDTLNEETSMRNLAAYFVKRTEALFHVPKEDIQRFREDFKDPESELFLISKEKIESSLKSLNTDFIALLEKEPIAVGQYLLREYFKVTQLKCHIKITKTQIRVSTYVPVNEELLIRFKKLLGSGLAVVVNDEIRLLTLKVKNTESFQEFEGDVVFEKYVSFTSKNKEFMLFFSGDDLIYHYFYKDIDWSVEKEVILGMHYNRKEKLKNQVVLSQIKQATESMQHIFEVFEEQDKIVYSQYIEYIQNLSMKCSNEKLEDILMVMNGNGFYDIFEGREDLLNMFSWLSLACSRGGFSLKAFKKLKMDMQLLEELETILVDYGFTMLYIHKGVIFMKGV